jgi:excisionase family DNA binding protein
MHRNTEPDQSLFGEGELTVTIPRTAAVLMVSERHVYRLIEMKVLEAVNFGRARRVTTRSIRRAAHGDAEHQQ